MYAFSKESNTSSTFFRMLIYDEVVYRSVGCFEKYGFRPRSDRLENKVTNVFKVRRNLLRSQRFEHMETKKKKTRSKTRLVLNTHPHTNRVRHMNTFQEFDNFFKFKTTNIEEWVLPMRTTLWAFFFS